MGEAIVAGARIAWERAGTGGTPLVLLHGLAGDRSSWDAPWTALAADREVIRYDLRDHGASVSTDDAPFAHPDDLAGLLDALRIERCDVAGLSLGGATALGFALNAPARVRRLVLVSPAIVGWDWSAAWRASWRGVAAAAREGGVAAARRAWWAHPLFDAVRAHPDAAARLLAALERYPGGAWLARSREAAALPDLDRLGGLAVPTLLLTGAEDLPDFRLIADLIAGAAPQVTRIDFAGAGHMLLHERPAEVTAAMRDFLG